MMDSRTLLVLVGPTAVGKTAMTLQLCRLFGAEVVSADSVQVYRSLDIGSAKPTLEEQALAPHHLIDVADPEEEFDAARFQNLADEAIDDIWRRGKRVLLAGGTGLYVRALLQGLAPTPPVNARLRRRLSLVWEERGAECLHGILARLDPESAARLHPADRQRVLRALEIRLQTGKSLSALHKEHGFKEERYPHLIIGLNLPRPELNQRIELRCSQMWELGLLAEVGNLLERGVSPRARSLQTLGYRHALAVLQGKATQEQARDLMIRDTKAYAKRQLTWFRGIKGINWQSPQDISQVSARMAEVWPGPGDKG